MKEPILVVRNQHGLTPAQQRVYRELLRGGTYRQIADRLYLTPDTVHSHASAIYRAFGVSGRADLPAQEAS